MSGGMTTHIDAFRKRFEARLKELGRADEFAAQVQMYRHMGDLPRPAWHRAATPYIEKAVLGPATEPAPTPRPISTEPVDLRRDIEWVYKAMGVAGVLPDQAPSSEAYMLLMWARQNEGRFITEFLLKCLSPLKAVEAGSAERGRERKEAAVVDVIQTFF